ncbi:Poglut3 [Scenedesmus sp. PABB004]|nr:Poglut3 [Scenedesmus sp. PABB004]
MARRGALLLLLAGLQLLAAPRIGGQLVNQSTIYKALLRQEGFNENVPRHELGEGNAGLVVVRNGTVQVHWLRGGDNHWRFACIKAAVEGARSLGFPDSAFVLNIDDFPICAEGRCPLPVFTNYKKWRHGRNLDTNEVLLPVFNHHYEDLYLFPWEAKRPTAFMRASQQGCMPPNSSRAVLAVTSEYHPGRLDLGITRIDGADKHFLKYRFSKASFTRLVKVMLTNSVVLKEESDWIEYYYRSLKPWKHYAPFTAGADAGDQVLRLVERLEGSPRTAAAIADEAQHWAYRHLSQYPRLLYLRRQLIEYNKLFGGQMEAWVAGGGPEALAGSSLAAARRRSSSRLAAAHLHLRRVARASAMRLHAAAHDGAGGAGAGLLDAEGSSSGGGRRAGRHFWLFGGR